MDLGISGKRALVCAGSKGLGRACAMHLAREGAQVTIVARSPEALQAAAADILADSGSKVVTVSADVATAEGRAAALAASPELDILVNNCGGPPPGDFRSFTRDDWVRAFDANMFSAIELIRSVVDDMAARKFGRIVNITSAAVKNPAPMLALSNGMRAGLTGFVGGVSREVARHNVTINNLLPGAFATDRLLQAFLPRAQNANLSVEEFMQKTAAASVSGRMGDPDEFGAACAFLCSQYGGYITGQNLVLDGGEFRGML